MTTQTLTNDCKFCSLVSKANGEDPIGTANPADGWVIVEIPQPWTKQSMMAHPALSQIFQALGQGGRKLMPMAVAPNPKYSVPGLVRLLFYQRPNRPFARYDKQEFLVPENQLAQLTEALLQQPNELDNFKTYQQSTSQIRDMMVCTHGNVDVACGRFGFPIYKQLSKYAAVSNGELRIWRCSHFGGHQFAPTLLDLPTGQFWGHLEPEILDCLVQRDTTVTELHGFYRGWAGVTKFEQMVERELWMQYGWEWLNYNKSAQVLAQDTSNESENSPDWAEIRFEFTAINNSIKRAYEARVEVCGSVMTAFNSGNEQSLKEVKQYRVSKLTPIKSN
ncbi:MAG: sucrase ferredoxin [Cyanobacteria bacterium P01_G01_bin.39]